MADCQSIADDVADLKQERSDLQRDLQGLDREPGEPKPSPSEKAAIAAEIRRVTARIDEKDRELRECLGAPQPLPAVTCPIVGTAVVATSSSTFPGPFALSTVPTLTFLSPAHTAAELAPISTSLPSFAVPSSPCTDTVSIQIPGATGTFDPATGDLSMQISAVVSHSLMGGFLNACAAFTPGPSATQSPLTTGTIPSALSGSISGAPLNRTTSTITLVASGVLTGGASQLAGTTLDLRISGSLACAPLP
jgi:hypothetical protein